MLSEARCTKLRSSAPKALMLALSWDLEVILIDGGGCGSVAMGLKNAQQRLAVRNKTDNASMAG